MKLRHPIATGRHASPQRTLLAIFGLALAALFVIGSLFSILNQVNQPSIAQRHRALRLLTADSVALTSAITTQESALQSYLSTTDPPFLMTYNQGLLKVPLLLDQLASNHTEMGFALSQIDQVKLAYDRWVTDYAAPIVADVRSNKQSVALVVEDSNLSLADGNALHRLISELEASASTQLALNTPINQDHLWIFGVVIVPALIMVILYWGVRTIVGTSFLRPIEALKRDVEEMSSHDLNLMISASGSDLLNELGENIEALRRRLRDEADELLQLRRVLDRRAPLQQIVRSELESDPESVTNLEISGKVLAADGILAGDWFDAWDTTDGRTVVSIVDVSGHGPEAGMLALRIKHLLEPAFNMALAPGEAFTWVAEQLTDLNEMCATSIAIEVDLKSGLCHYANAGHPDLLHLTQDGLIRLGRTGTLICGVGGQWETQSFPITKGDLLVLVTDGYTEALLPDNSEFGLDRICRIVEGLGRSSQVEDIVERLTSEVRSLCKGPLKDDATVAVVRVN